MKSYLRVTSAGVDGFEIVGRKEKDADCTVEFIYKNNTLRISGVNEGAAIPDSTLINGTSYLYQELNEMYSDLASILMIKFDESIASVGANSFYATSAKEYVVSSGTEIDDTAFAASSIRNKRENSPTPEPTPAPAPAPETEPTTNDAPKQTDESKPEKSKSPKKEVNDLGTFTRDDYNDEPHFAIPDGYTGIEERAFADTQLTYIKIPNSVETIGDHAFDGTKLRSVEIPNSVKIIGDYAFFTSRLKSVEIPNSVKIIGNYAFGATRLSSVEIPDSIKTIGEGAFANTQLKSVEIPNSLKTIGPAFAYTPLKSVEIPGSVKKIGTDAFREAELTSVEIPNSVKKIGNSAFLGTKLRSVEIPNSVKIIDGYAFFSSPLESVEIPNSVKIISESAFRQTKLTSVEIPKSVKTIGLDAFNTLHLTSVTFKNSSLDIHEDAFRGSSVNEITLSNEKQAYAFRRQHKGKFPGSVNVLNKKGELLFVLDALKPSDTGSNAEATEPKTVPSGNEQACPDFQALDQEKIHFINSKNSTKRFVGAEGVSDYFIFSGRKAFEQASTSRLETISGFETNHDQIIIGASKRLPGSGEFDDIKITKTSASTRDALQESTPLIFNAAEGTLIYNQNGKAPSWGDHGGLVLKVEGNVDCFTEQNLLII